MMPGIDGYEMTKQIKTDMRTSHIPVVMLTAKADLDSRIEGLELGAEAYLTKPFSKRELLVRVRKLFDLRKTLQDHYWNTYANNGNGKHNGVFPERESIFMQKVRSVIEAQLDNPELNVAALADNLHMSYSQLYRKIKSLTGRTPNFLINNMRLQKACELLVHTDKSISETAFDVGYEDPAYFARLFKKTYGITPTKYCEGQALNPF
jgi:YesN/AraC family two-component response regulator